MRWYRSCIQSRTEAGCGIKRRRTIVSSLIHKTVLFICKESGGEREVDGRRIPGIWSLWYWKNIFWCVISDIWLSIMLNWNVWQGFCIACGEYCKWRVNTWLGCDFGDNFLHRWGEVLELVPGGRRLRTIFCFYKLFYEPELKYQWKPVLFPYHGRRITTALLIWGLNFLWKPPVYH